MGHRSFKKQLQKLLKFICMGSEIPPGGIPVHVVLGIYSEMTVCLHDSGKQYLPVPVFPAPN